jgi:hypothetical protein
MSSAADLVTVYRSMDATAKADCETLLAVLAEHQFDAVLLEDDTPNVPEGTFEVRVPADQAAGAEELLARNQLPDEARDFDPSSTLDLETIFRGEGDELEALTIKGLLESNGIATVLMGDAVLPNLTFELKVASSQAETARKIIAEAEIPDDRQDDDTQD